jgi:diaminopimelate epimerase
LDGKQGEINISVSGVKNTLKAGVNNSGEAWVQMPVNNNLDVTEINTGLYLVKMEGIVHLVIQQEQAKHYLDSSKKTIDFKENLKKTASELLQKNNLGIYPAAGIIFLEDTENGIKIHPCVTVPGISSYYETACGSGTIAAALVQCFKSKENKNIEISLIQPSNQVIKAVIEWKNRQIHNAVICGSVKTEGEHTVSLSEILSYL